jgi:hypothetical protein
MGCNLVPPEAGLFAEDVVAKCEVRRRSRLNTAPIRFRNGNLTAGLPTRSSEARGGRRFKTPRFRSWFLLTTNGTPQAIICHSMIFRQLEALRSMTSYHS